jgi:ribosomal protein S18 acetylase RimI-like enzyme
VALVADEWLSERLGRPMFTAGPGDAGAVREHAAENPGSSYQGRVPTERVDEVRDLADAGFYVVDVNLTMSRQPGSLDGGGDWEVREATPDDGPALVAIAERGFRFDRFHLDPAIDDATADRIKRDWVQSCVDGKRGEQLLVVVRDGDSAGFLAVVRRGGERIVDLMGVDPDLRGQGAGRALLARFVSDSAGCERVRAGTQAANVAATRMYEAAGFALAASAYNMHLHA